MVWHGGISGSALTKVAESNHIREITNNPVMPEFISFKDTVFSSMNCMAILLLIIIVPAISYLIGKLTTKEIPQITTLKHAPEKLVKTSGAERIDQSKWVSRIIGILLTAIAIYIAIVSKNNLGFINPNYINFSLLGLNLLLYKNIRSFLSGVDKAISGSAGILIQFPLYFGILALMQNGGLIEIILKLQSLIMLYWLSNFPSS